MKRLMALTFLIGFPFLTLAQTSANTELVREAKKVEKLNQTEPVKTGKTSTKSTSKVKKSSESVLKSTKAAKPSVGSSTEPEAESASSPSDTVEISTPSETPSSSPEKKPTISDQVGEVFDGVKGAHRDFVKKAETVRGENRYFGALEWTPIDLLIPIKFGAHVGYNENANKSYELEYIRGSLSAPFFLKDLGSMIDDRFAFTVRHYSGGTFNLFYGLDYVRFRIHLADEILSRSTAFGGPGADVLELGGLGAHVGLGNRWALTEHVQFGVDWFSWTQPLYTTHRKSSFLKYAGVDEDKDDVRRVLRVVEYFPRFTLFRLSLGATF